MVRSFEDSRKIAGNTHELVGDILQLLDSAVGPFETGGVNLWGRPLGSVVRLSAAGSGYSCPGWESVVLARSVPEMIDHEILAGQNRERIWADG